MSDSDDSEDLYFDDWLFYRNRRNERHYNEYTTRSSIRQEKQ